MDVVKDPGNIAFDTAEIVVYIDFIEQFFACSSFSLSVIVASYPREKRSDTTHGGVVPRCKLSK